MSLKERLGLTDDPLFLMDGSAFIYRGFFANRNMQRSDGFPTNALVVVTRVLLRILREEDPRYFVFVKDGRGKNFRHDLFPLYKANRDAMPEDLVRQIEPVQRMVTALGLRLEISEGCEADDCIASLAARFSGQRPVIIVSGDKDLKQCLGPNVYMWDPGTREEKLLDEAAFRAETGLDPACWPDMQALIGDTSDNIPGVPGIGPKTAARIFTLCPGLEEIRDHFDRLPPKLQDKLRDHLDKMFLWRELTSLSRDRCANISLEDLVVRPLDVGACHSLAEEFELTALRREMAALVRRQEREGRQVQEGETSLDASTVLQSASLQPSSPQQIGLLGLLQDSRTTSLPEVAELADLPDCTGETVALVWPQGSQQPPHLAVEGSRKALCWTGRMDILCSWLGKARQLVLADLKALLVAAPCWRTLLGGEFTGCPAVFDLGLAAYLLEPEDADYGWPRLASRWANALGVPAESPALLALGMAHALAERLEAQGLRQLYDSLELPLTPVLAAMEGRGVAIDASAFQLFLHDVQGQLDALTAAVYEAAGTRFNIRSAQQLGEVLFEKLKLETSRKTRGGQLSTSQQALEKLAGQHSVVDSILQYRKLEKMRSTYLDPLPRLVDAQGRIHTTFNQKATATGRLSSSNPNLQNIPVRGPLGKRMRACFIAGPGQALVSADYSQVELRVLAHMSQDAALLDAFRQGQDIHARTAALIYDIRPEEVSPEQRRNAKTINFGLVYGMGAQKLAQELKISLNEARDFIARYFARLTGLKAFYEQVEASARELGYVTTLAGRRRPVPDIASSNGQASALARRQAINTVIQGSAADIIKLAMLAVAQDGTLHRLQARLLLQVHDELLLEVPEPDAAEAGQRVAQLMQDVAPGGQPLAVPLLVDWGLGANWGMAH